MEFFKASPLLNLQSEIPVELTFGFVYQRLRARVWRQRVHARRSARASRSAFPTLCSTFARRRWARTRGLLIFCRVDVRATASVQARESLLPLS